jgi:hypothetical protein
LAEDQDGRGEAHRRDPGEPLGLHQIEADGTDGVPGEEDRDAEDRRAGPATSAADATVELTVSLDPVAATAVIATS